MSPNNRSSDRVVKEPDSSDLVQEAKLLFQIALPTVAVQFNVYFIFPQTASVVGRHLGVEALASFSLASLTGNLLVLSIIMGVLTAADTLMPRAFGNGQFSEVGRLAARGFVASILVLAIPLYLLTFRMDSIFESLGQDPYVSMAASLWLRVYVIGVGFVLVFRIMQRFLACQHIVFPMVLGSGIGCFLIHPLMLLWLIPTLGFLGSGVAVVVTQAACVVLVFIILKLRPAYHADTWTGLSCSFLLESMQPESMLHFLKLSLGGVLSFTEWWFWETVCFVAGYVGVIPLCIHTIAYNLIPVTFMFPLGMSIGLSVRMGHVLGKDVARAKKMAVICMSFTVLVACIVALTLYHMQDFIVALCTNEQEVIEGCRDIWGNFCVYIVLLYIFGINSGILRALGFQWRMGGIILSVLWGLTCPALLHLVVRKGGGIGEIWSILPCAYFVLNLLLTFTYTTADWTAISHEIRLRADQHVQAETERGSEHTPLNTDRRRLNA